MSWSSVCVKYLLFVFNFLFVVSGVIVLSIGVTIKAYYNDYQLILNDKYFSTPNLLIVIGAIIFVIAFFGCCGAIRENFCMVVTFSTLLILIFVLEFAAGISGYVLRSQTAEYLEGKLNESMYRYQVNNSKDPLTILWDDIQMEFECCGVKSPTDWFKVNATAKNLLPMSCCGPQYGHLENVTCNNHTTTLFKVGCVDKFGHFVEEHAITIGSSALVLAFAQLLGIVFACHLSRRIKKNYETV